MSGSPSLTILSEEQKFNGENLLQWKTNLTQLLGSKGLWGYVDGKIAKPTGTILTTQAADSESSTTSRTTQTTVVTTPIYSTRLTLDEWIFRDQLARGHITLNCTDTMSLGVKTDGTAKEAWKAVEGNFDIIGEGNVVQRYKVDGRERDITYTRALHAPTLNANLVSVGALDKAGITTTFGGGKGARTSNGTVVLDGTNVNGMYILETVDNLPHQTIAMKSSAQPTSLHQLEWHRRLTHCSPLTIKEMISENLVDGLRVTESTPRI